MDNLLNRIKKFSYFTIPLLTVPLFFTYGADRDSSLYVNKPKLINIKVKTNLNKVKNSNNLKGLKKNLEEYQEVLKDIMNESTMGFHKEFLEKTYLYLNNKKLKVNRLEEAIFWIIYFSKPFYSINLKINPIGLLACENTPDFNYDILKFYERGKGYLGPLQLSKSAIKDVFTGFTYYMLNKLSKNSRFYKQIDKFFKKTPYKSFRNFLKLGNLYFRGKNDEFKRLYNKLPKYLKTAVYYLVGVSFYSKNVYRLMKNKKLSNLFNIYDQDYRTILINNIAAYLYNMGYNYKSFKYLKNALDSFDKNKVDYFSNKYFSKRAKNRKEVGYRYFSTQHKFLVELMKRGLFYLDKINISY